MQILSLRLLLLVLLPAASMTTKLRASVYNSPPVMMWMGTEDNLTAVRGLAAQIIQHLAEAANVELSYVPVKDAEVYEYGLANAIIRQSVNQEIDIAPYFFLQSAERNEIVDFLDGLFHEYKLMVTHPELDMDELPISAVAKPFQLTVWIVIMISYIIAWAVTELRRHQASILETNHQTRHAEGTRSVNYLVSFNWRMFAGTWSLMMIVLSNSYTTALISDSTVIKMKPIPNSFEELAQDPSRKLVIERVMLGDSILNAKSGALKILGDQLRKNPELVISSRREIIPNVLEGRAYVGAAGIIDYFIGEDLKKHSRKCNFASSQPLLMKFHAFSIMKNSPLREIMMIKSIEMNEHNTVKYYAPKFNFAKLRCKLQPITVKKKPTPLGRKELSGAFLVLGIGAVSALSLFILENIFWMFRQRARPIRERKTDQP